MPAELGSNRLQKKESPSCDSDSFLLHDVLLHDVLLHDVLLHDVLLHDVLLHDVLFHKAEVYDVGHPAGSESTWPRGVSNHGLNPRSETERN
jgi:hypothetical protein